MTTLTDSQYNKLQKIEQKAYKTAWSLKKVSPAESKVLQGIKTQWDSFCTELGIFNKYNDEAQYIAPVAKKEAIHSMMRTVKNHFMSYKQYLDPANWFTACDFGTWKPTNKKR